MSEVGSRYLSCGGLVSVFRFLARNSKREVTGLVFGEGGRCDILIVIRNVHPRPFSRFTMDPWGIVVAHRVGEYYGLDLIAVFHTHPCGSAKPSSIDQRFMRQWRVPWIIASGDGELAGWLYNTDNSNSLLRVYIA